MESGSVPGIPLSEVEEAEKARQAAIDEARRRAESAPSEPTPGSLRERMQRRREEVEQRTTEFFPVPMFDKIVAVECRAISWAKSEAAITRNQRIPSQAMLYTAADEIIAATEGFYEITEQGTVGERVEDAHSWYTLATRLAGKKLGEGTSERVSIIALCTDQGVIALNTAYRQWLGGADTGLSQVEKEVRQDF